MAVDPLVHPPILDVRPLRAHEALELRVFLLADRGANAFLLGWVESYGAVPTAEGNFEFIGVFAGRELQCVALLAGGDVCCLSHGDPAGASSVGARLRRQQATLRTLVGPTATVDAFRRGLRDETSAIVLNQRTYVLRPENLILQSMPTLREAVPGDIPELIRTGLAMHCDEVGRPVPADRREVFERSVELKVRVGRTWLCCDPYDDSIVFKASISAACRDVAQIEGVWVEPTRRRQGIATRATGELCGRLLASHSLISLYVGLDNIAARDVYRRLGFHAGTPYQSILFER